MRWMQAPTLVGLGFLGLSACGGSATPTNETGGESPILAEPEVPDDVETRQMSREPVIQTTVDTHPRTHHAISVDDEWVGRIQQIVRQKYLVDLKACADEVGADAVATTSFTVGVDGHLSDIAIDTPEPRYGECIKPKMSMWILEGERTEDGVVEARLEGLPFVIRIR